MIFCRRSSISILAAAKSSLHPYLPTRFLPLVFLLSLSFLYQRNSTNRDGWVAALRLFRLLEWPLQGLCPEFPAQLLIQARWVRCLRRRPERRARVARTP